MYLAKARVPELQDIVEERDSEISVSLDFSPENVNEHRELTTCLESSANYSDYEHEELQDINHEITVINTYQDDSEDVADVFGKVEQPSVYTVNTNDGSSGGRRSTDSHCSDEFGSFFEKDRCDGMRVKANRTMDTRVINVTSDSS